MSHLSTAQLQTWRDHIAANTNTVTYAGASTAIKDVPKTVGGLPNGDGADAVAGWYNLAAAPTYNLYVDALLFTKWVNDPAFQFDQIDALSVGKARIMEYLRALVTMCPAFASVRNGVENALTVAGNAATKAAFYALARRAATNFEKLYVVASGDAFATGNRGDTTKPDVPGIGGAAVSAGGGKFILGATDGDHVQQAWVS